ncbi:hypothetical protein A3D80_01565 [Candidatus Roizmanbacteria bacterium RIFCSPHIGHO2_02_FULL_40_13b]|uniref:Uncharacterized protein n=1 Tax=Candidatus Roizmanbacteria bacterium RIFCSPHIGHO2_01_FULL_39_24 TaxID=1802032 RepID=A0A1F7GFB8_9BACT|nr:MAG: hypothetical protein A2799_00880 [Candidatus Roizmanbacteria bacterium RIFCSPHIGHO2_01_FULL_39_24]OGK26813.1 MAG: hypothetical protein A3D80_01565 [Candidatus Roizmanbacteria bacterium RIFCSPHIGHO2_02_FULL_40_13b]OGK48736.1 MAG: hypothetical protein A3A56_03100 [Candidatus Roizmanbacteria bacterium RIFCSPLOWO2_01_FULL_40_32]
MKLRFPSEYKKQLSEKLMEMGNFIFVGFVVSHFVEYGKISSQLFITGFTTGLLFYFISYFIMISI